MMRWVLLIILAASSGCASISDVQQKPVMAQFESKRSVAEISSCLAGIMSRQKGIIVRTVPTERGVILSESMQVNFYSTVFTTTEIEDRGGFRSVTVKSMAKPKENITSGYGELFGPCLRS